MAQSVKHWILDFGSGQHLTVHEIEPHIGLCTDNAEPAWDSLSSSFCPSLACLCVLVLSLSLKKKKVQGHLDGSVS